MTGTAAALLAVVAVAAVSDWAAVAAERRPVEYACKPLTLAALIGVAVSLDPVDPTVRAWFVVALALSLVGDVLLMLPRDLFVFGLGAFLLAHVGYVVGLVAAGLDPAGVAAGLVVVGLAGAVVGSRLVRGIRRAEPAMAPPVVAYMAVISAMVVAATGTLHAAAVAGSLLFYASDALIGWGRFVRAVPHGRAAVMVTYHLAQVLLVLSLL